MSTLDILILQARKIKMTPEQQEAQRRDFAYGNVHLSNPDVTREIVDQEADKLNDKKRKP